MYNSYQYSSSRTSLEGKQRPDAADEMLFINLNVRSSVCC